MITETKPNRNARRDAWRRANIAAGLRHDGRERQYRPYQKRGGLSKSHSAYMRAWRAERRPDYSDWPLQCSVCGRGWSSGKTCLETQDHDQCGGKLVERRPAPSPENQNEP